MKKTFDFATAMKELEEINTWFQEEDIDLDVGLEKLKKAKELIGQCRDRLKNVENEFVKIKDEFTPAEIPQTPPPANKYIAKNEPVKQSSVLPDPFADDSTDDDDLPF